VRSVRVLVMIAKVGVGIPDHLLVTDMCTRRERRSLLAPREVTTRDGATVLEVWPCWFGGV
jgi:hypothetical protein